MAPAYCPKKYSPTGRTGFYKKTAVKAKPSTADQKHFVIENKILITAPHIPGLPGLRRSPRNG
jgi:hypothetical protein